MIDIPQTIAALIVARRIETPRIAIILGSGLGDIAAGVQSPTIIPYADLPGFPVSGVSGHAGRIVLGRLGTVPVVAMQGRVHLYEGMGHNDIKIFVRTLKRLGCEAVLITNAAGGLRRDLPPGSLMMVSDHINLIPGNPLIGPNDDLYGDRFPTLEDAYDPGLRDRLRRAADRLGIRLHEGVYVGCLGPSFETPAEIRAYARLGGDAVGMSTVPEVIVARHCGLRVAALSVITNFAAGLGESAHGHAETLSEAAKAATNVGRLLTGFLEEYAQEAARTD